MLLFSLDTKRIPGEYILHNLMIFYPTYLLDRYVNKKANNSICERIIGNFVFEDSFVSRVVENIKYVGQSYHESHTCNFDQSLISERNNLIDRVVKMVEFSSLDLVYVRLGLILNFLLTSAYIQFTKKCVQDDERCENCKK